MHFSSGVGDISNKNLTKTRNSRSIRSYGKIAKSKKLLSVVEVNEGILET